MAGAIVLILLLIFILENTQSVKISYFGASGHVALGVALLFAAVGGALLVGILGAARIAQLGVTRNATPVRSGIDRSCRGSTGELERSCPARNSRRRARS